MGRTLAEGDSAGSVQGEGRNLHELTASVVTVSVGFGSRGELSRARAHVGAGARSGRGGGVWKGGGFCRFRLQPLPGPYT